MRMAVASRILVVLAGLLAAANASRLHAISGRCDFETNDFCDLFGNHDFIIQSGNPGVDATSMDSGYSGDGYLVLDRFNSESTIQTPIMTPEFEDVQVHFAYFLNGEGDSQSYIRLYQKTEGGDPIQLWAASEHDNQWHYVDLTLTVAVGQSFELLWKAEAYKALFGVRHAWVALDYIEVVDNGGPDNCFMPPPTQFADPWDCATATNDGAMTRAELLDGTLCYTQCKDTFTAQGDPSIMCNDGTWVNPSGSVFLCLDTQGPQFQQCPGDLEELTPYGWGSMWYTVGQPEVTDNSGYFDVQLYFDDVLELDTTITLNLGAGTYNVRYEATDIFNNANTCSYNVIVETGDQMAPQVVSCPESTTLESDAPIVVTWEEPVFQDDSGYIDRVESNFASGSLMAWGQHEVVYAAFDNSSNTATCHFTETIKGLPCHVLSLPVFGALVCHDSFAGRFCVPMCGPQGDFEVPAGELTVPSDYLCSTSGNWYPYEFTYDCLAEYGEVPAMSSDYYYGANCDDPTSQEAMRQQALVIYNESDADDTMGTDLTSDDFYVRCGPYV